jgi:hypothetical protein
LLVEVVAAVLQTHRETNVPVEEVLAGLELEPHFL